MAGRPQKPKFSAGDRVVVFGDGVIPDGTYGTVAESDSVIPWVSFPTWDEGKELGTTFRGFTQCEPMDQDNLWLAEEHADNGSDEVAVDTKMYTPIVGPTFEPGSELFVTFPLMGGIIAEVRSPTDYTKTHTKAFSHYQDFLEWLAIADA